MKITYNPLSGDYDMVDGGSYLDDAADEIKDSHIDWGSGSGQVNLDDVPDGSTYEKVKATELSDGEIRASIKEIIQATSDTLTPVELKGTIITNYGQGASNNLQILPTAVEGMSFIVMCGTAQGGNHFRFQADSSDKIYLDGVAGGDNGYVTIAAPVVGAMVQFFTFQTGFEVYDWAAVTIFGNWVAG